MPNVIAYAYEAEIHCPDCARERFGDALDEPNTQDDEGNPIGAVFSTDEHPKGLSCGDCNEELREPIWADRRLYRIHISPTSDDPTQFFATVTGPYADQWADFHGSLDGGTWERVDGPTHVYDILLWRPGLFDELMADGYIFDLSEYSEPDENDLAIAQHAADCEACSYDWHKAEKDIRRGTDASKT
jgi:hypothetical protein